MAEANGNNQANVSSAKGVKGGYIFSAPEGTALPTDIKTPLDPAFKCLGFISEDGYVETVDEDSDDIPDMNGVITVKHNSNSHDIFSYVLELVLKNNRRWRKVIPAGKSAELDDLNISSSELCQRPLTMKYLTDEDGNTCYDYFESTETTATA